VTDYEKILNVISRVGRCFDEADLKGFLGCWADGGVLNFVAADWSVQGSVRREEMEQKLVPLMPTYPDKHLVSLPDIEIDGDEAVAYYYTMYPSAGPTAEAPGLSRSHMVLRRQADGRWKVTLHNLNSVYKRGGAEAH
jgi:ketosteroid isomerase-like protein